MQIERKIDAWHFVGDDAILAHPGGNGLAVVPGYIYSEDSPELEICRTGLHGSRRVYDALGFAPGPMLCRVKMWGDVSEQTDRLVARHREVVAMRDVSSELRLWGCWCVRNTPISDGRTTWDLLTDERSRNAVVVAEKFARNEVTRKELAAARNAAWAAARNAAWSAAGAAAWDATRDAAWDAAGAAARDAARDAAGDAAGAAAGVLHADELDRRMTELFR